MTFFPATGHLAIFLLHILHALKIRVEHRRPPPFVSLLVYYNLCLKFNSVTFTASALVAERTWKFQTLWKRDSKWQCTRETKKTQLTSRSLLRVVVNRVELLPAQENSRKIIKSFKAFILTTGNSGNSKPFGKWGKIVIWASTCHWCLTTNAFTFIEVQCSKALHYCIGIGMWRGHNSHPILHNCLWLDLYSRRREVEKFLLFCQFASALHSFKDA